MVGTKFIVVSTIKSSSHFNFTIFNAFDYTTSQLHLFCSFFFRFVAFAKNENTDDNHQLPHENNVEKKKKKTLLQIIMY